MADTSKDTDVSDGKAEATETTQTPTTPDGGANKLAELQSQLKEAQGEIAKLKPLAADAEKAIEQRQKAKEKAGEFETLYNELKPKAEDAEKRYTELEKQYNELIAKIRKDKLELVPESLRDELKDASLETIDIAIRAAQTKPAKAGDGGTKKPDPDETAEKNALEMSGAERIAYMQKHGQQAWSKKYAEDYKLKQSKK